MFERGRPQAVPAAAGLCDAAGEEQSKDAANEEAEHRHPGLWGTQASRLPKPIKRLCRQDACWPHRQDVCAPQQPRANIPVASRR